MAVFDNDISDNNPFPNGEESRQDVLSHMNLIHSSMDDIHSLFEFIYFHIFLNHDG